MDTLRRGLNLKGRSHQHHHHKDDKRNSKKDDKKDGRERH